MLVIPSLVPGGMERVMTELAGYFSGQKGVDVYLISLVSRDIFYDIPNEVTFIAPGFSMFQKIRLLSLLRTYFYLRKQISDIKPYCLLSFGGKYNAFVLLACVGIPVKTYISDRSRPGISYGWLLDHLNPLLYKRADGIIAQTERAKDVLSLKTGHGNIRVIGNPVKIVTTTAKEKEKNILNIGRFVTSKGQEELLNIFADIRFGTWRLVFIGDGPCLEKVKSVAAELGIENYVEFIGVTKNVGKYYAGSLIFAFTSSSEGFPNTLAEAMSHGLACISYDCEAGPSDLIDNGVNGYLVPLNDREDFKAGLLTLMNDSALCHAFGESALEKVRNYDINIIGREYLEFITK